MTKKYRDFVVSTKTIYAGLRHIRKTAVAEYGLKSAETTILVGLSFHPEGLTNTEIVNLCGIDKAAVSRSLAHLNAEGYILIDYRGGSSRYGARIFLSEKGKEATGAVEKQITKVIAECSEGFSKEEKALFEKMLKQFAENMQEKVKISF